MTVRVPSPAGRKRYTIYRFKDLAMFRLRVGFAINVHGKTAGPCDGRLAPEEVEKPSFPLRYFEIYFLRGGAQPLFSLALPQPIIDGGQFLEVSFSDRGVSRRV